jgi:hypothetical protein
VDLHHRVRQSCGMHPITDRNLFMHVDKGKVSQNPIARITNQNGGVANEKIEPLTMSAAAPPGVKVNRWKLPLLARLRKGPVYRSGFSTIFMQSSCLLVKIS